MERAPGSGGGAKPAGRADLVGGAFVALATSQFGAIVILGKIVTDGGLPVASFLAVRFIVAATLLAVMLAVLRQPLSAAPGEGWKLVVLGVAGYAVESSLFFLAIHHGGPAAVTLLFYSYPVWVTGLAAVTGRGLPGALVAGALAFAVAGAALVVLGSGGIEITAAGIAFAVAASVMFALYLTGADASLSRTNSLTGAMWVSGSAGLALAIQAVATGHGQLPHGSHQWVPVLAVAVFSAGAFACLFAGLRRLGAVRTSIVAASEPLVAATLSVIFLGEQLRAGTVAGGALILIGAVAAALARKDATGPRAEPPIP
jgi:drug/metabolite transporter (DMT)-like permease